MGSSEKFREGKLAEAVEAAVREVKERPGDPSRRMLLAELLCFAGDLSRADLQLDAIVGIDPALAMTVAALRQLLRGEGSRRQVWSEGRVPELLEAPSEEIRLRLKALVCLREGRGADASAALEAAEGLRSSLKGAVDGVPFDGLRDLDDRMASFLEVLTSTGKYYWIPLGRVELLEFEKPERPADLLWRRARLSVRGGPDGQVWIPALYPGSSSSADEAVRLGRSTDWAGEPPMVAGLGQRILFAGDRDLPLLEIGRIEVAPADGGSEA